MFSVNLSAVTTAETLDKAKTEKIAKVKKKPVKRFVQNMTQRILENKIAQRLERKTAKEILYESKKELERDEQERLSLSCLGNSTRVTNVQFRRMTQKRMLARQKIAALIKKSNRLKMAIQELEFKNWSKPK